MNNEHSFGYFIVLEVGECASLCAFVDLEEFLLTPSKGLRFGDSIKVMHDRMTDANAILHQTHIAMVG